MREPIRKILITGGAGFIGSEFVRQLALDRDCPRQITNKSPKRGLSLIVIDNLTYAGDLARLKEASNKYKFYKADVANPQQIEAVFKAERPDVIVHFAAESHVDRSIKCCGEFIESNIKGTQILLDASKMYNVSKFIHISCYDDKTRALTTDGLKTYKELKVGDKVFSLNPQTQEIEVKSIEKVIVQHYHGDMVHFKNKRINILVTPNHRMFVLNANKNSKKLNIDSAENVSTRAISYLPKGYWNGKEDEYYNIEGFGKVPIAELMYILGIFIGDGFCAYQEKYADTKTGLGREEYLKKAKDAKTGRFIKIDKTSTHVSTLHSYRIFFDIPENDKSRDKVETALRRLGIKYHVHKGKAGTHVYFTSKIFMDFFAQCGHGARNKHIPAWAMEYAPKYLKYLFNGLMDSDGSGAKIYYTISEKLAFDFCELSIKLGFSPVLSKRHTKSFLRGRKIEGDSYYISISKSVKSILRHKIKRVNYDGVIWCLKIKDNKNFVIEREGKFDFCGNTDEVYGDIKKGKFIESSPLQPNSPYAASKAAADLLVKAYIRTYNFPAIIVRPCNNYGPWQYPEKLIPLTILNIMRGKKTPVYARGQNVREWMHVSDTSAAILKIMEKGRLGQTYNIGTGSEHKNIDLVKRIIRILGKSEKLIEYVKDRPGHDLRYALDTRKMKKEIGWQPRINFSNGLEATVKWYITNLKWTHKHFAKKLSIKF